MLQVGWVWEGGHRALGGLVLLQVCDMDGGRGSAAPLVQVAILEEQVECREGHARLSWGSAQGAGDPTLGVHRLAALLWMQLDGRASEGHWFYFPESHAVVLFPSLLPDRMLYKWVTCHLKSLCTGASVEREAVR